MLYNIRLRASLLINLKKSYDMCSYVYFLLANKLESRRTNHNFNIIFYT